MAAMAVSHRGTLEETSGGRRGTRGPPRVRAYSDCEGTSSTMYAGQGIVRKGSPPTAFAASQSSLLQTQTTGVRLGLRPSITTDRKSVV